MFSAKMGVSASFGVIWIYAAELFPTVVRTNALSMGSMVGRVGGIGKLSFLGFSRLEMICDNFKVCPLLTGITSLPWLYPLVFGVACLFAGFLILFLPETAGKPMMSTIEEAEMYYKNRAQTVTASIRKWFEILSKIAFQGSYLKFFFQRCYPLTNL